MFFQEERENDHIVNVNLEESIIWSEYSINLTLHVCWRIFAFHDRNVERFLISMSDDREFVTIIRVYSSLIEKEDCIHYCDVFAFFNSWENVALYRYEISIELNEMIQTSYVHDSVLGLANNLRCHLRYQLLWDDKKLNTSYVRSTESKIDDWFASEEIWSRDESTKDSSNF